MQNESGAHAVRLGDYFVLLRRQWPVILLCLALGIGAAVAYLEWAPKEYRSTTSVLVTEMETDSSSERNATINLDTEAQLVTSTETVARAAEALDIPVGTAADRIRVSVPPNTEILDLTYVAGTAADAHRGSLAFAEAYLEQRAANGQEVLDSQAEAQQVRIDAVREQLAETDREAARLPEDSVARERAEAEATRLDQQLSTLESNQSRLRTETLTPGRIVTQPRVPSSPSSPDPVMTIAAGTLLGLVLGLMLGALRHRRDDLIRTPEDLFHRTRVPVAAVLSTPLHSRDVSVLKPVSADGRGYARLRNLVTTSLEESDRRVVLVAGVRRGGGPVAANLAASLARSGEQVYLVCADVFGATADALLDGRPGRGLAEVLAGEVAVVKATRTLRSVPDLKVLGPGLDPDRADALLQTKGLRKLVDDLLAEASYVIIEAPATTDSPDAQTLAGVADLAVLVVEAGQTSAREVIDAVTQVESMNAAVLGAVVARYGRDGDPHQRRTGAAAAAADDPAKRIGKIVVDGDRVEEDVLDEESLTEEPVLGKPAAVGTPPSPADDTVRGAGGRPQLVPPGSAGPSGR